MHNLFHEISSGVSKFGTERGMPPNSLLFVFTYRRLGSTFCTSAPKSWEFWVKPAWKEVVSQFCDAIRLICPSESNCHPVLPHPLAVVLLCLTSYHCLLLDLHRSPLDTVCFVFSTVIFILLDFLIGACGLFSFQ